MPEEEEGVAKEEVRTEEPVTGGPEPRTVATKGPEELPATPKVDTLKILFLSCIFSFSSDFRSDVL